MIPKLEIVSTQRLKLRKVDEEGMNMLFNQGSDEEIMFMLGLDSEEKLQEEKRK